MSKKRKQYSPQFKAKVAIEAIQGQKTTPAQVANLVQSRAAKLGYSSYPS